MSFKIRINTTVLLTIIFTLWSSVFNVVVYEPYKQSSGEFKSLLSEDYESLANNSVETTKKTSVLPAKARENNVSNDHNTHLRQEGSIPKGRKRLKESSTTPTQKIETSDKNKMNNVKNVKNVNNNNDFDEDKSIFLLHVGPHKTASSNLQHFIFNSTVFNDSLKEDNYLLPRFNNGQQFRHWHGKNHAKLVHCFLKENRFCSGEERTDLLGQFKSFLDDAASDDKNVLFTSESLDFPSFAMDEFMSYLTPHFNVHVVVYYRRFYDWIFSTYQQQTRKRGLNAQAFPTFQDWLGRKIVSSKSKYSKSVRNRFQVAPGVFNVSVVNLHRKGAGSEHVQQFFCDHVDKAPHSCKAARTVDNRKLVPSTDPNWLALRSKVQLHHSIKLEMEDRRWDQIEEKFKRMTNFPRTCLSDDMKEEVLRLSLEYEIALTPKSWHEGPDGLEDLKRGFEKIANTKFCAIDFEKVLTSTKWQRFLTKLERS